MNYADFEASMGKDDEAEKLLRQLLDLERRILGPHQPETGETVYNLACLAAKHGRIDEAISLLSEAIEIGLPPRVASGMGEDPDLKPLRGNPRFTALIAQTKEHAAAQKTN
jgi:tetratricopeptide (TPR) repeat protein